MARCKRDRKPGLAYWMAVWLAPLIVLSSLLWAAESFSAGPVSSPPSNRATRVARVGMTVEEMDRSVEFYTRVLGFQKRSDVEAFGSELERSTGVFGARCRTVMLSLGEEMLELTEYLTPRGRLVPRDSRSNDRWFQHVAIIVSDMEKAYARLREFKVRHSSTSPQRLPNWNPNAGGIRAFYFHDPDGHVLEILQFPTGKGEKRWQAKNPLFLGIDHTAIVVEETERSLTFYRDRLGLSVVGTSENWEDEQAHLNNVRDARLRITTLAAPRGGIKVELLDYLSPRDGRPYPHAAQANDLFHWETVVEADGSSAETTLIRDPDQHAVRLISPR